MKLTNLDNQNFTCNSCTKCCRDWHVSLSSKEVQQLESFNWNDLGLKEQTPVMLIDGKPYISHKSDGSCLFLNQENGLCRIHSDFGEKYKPLGCRVYPYKLTRTFNDEVAVSARYDCPTIRSGKGRPFRNSKKQLEKIAAEMSLTPAFDDKTCGGLKRSSLDFIIPFIIHRIQRLQSNTDKVLFLYHFSSSLRKLGPEFLNQENSDLQEILDPIADNLLTLHRPASVKRSGALSRMSFRMLLGCYLRRDEDLINSRINRTDRVKSLLCFTFAFGSMRDLGRSHLEGDWLKAGLFNGNTPLHNKIEVQLFWRFIENQLRSWNFMGATNNNRDFFSGLESLALLYPLTIAVAKYYQGNRGHDKIHFDDLSEAVAAIAHSFGQSTILKSNFASNLEKSLLEKDNFKRLLFTI